MFDKVRHAVATALDAAAGLVGLRVGEEPAYEVVGRAAAAEIRRYGARLVAETSVAGAQRGLPPPCRLHLRRQ
jgi:hypothetical protein